MFSITTDSKWIKAVKVVVCIYSICFVIAGIYLGVIFSETVWGHEAGPIIFWTLIGIIGAVLTYICGMALCEFLYNVHFIAQKMNKVALHSSSEVNSDELPEL